MQLTLFTHNSSLKYMISCTRWSMLKGKICTYPLLVWCLLIDLMDLDWSAMRIDGARRIDADGWPITAIHHHLHFYLYITCNKGFTNILTCPGKINQLTTCDLNEALNLTASQNMEFMCVFLLIILSYAVLGPRLLIAAEKIDAKCLHLSGSAPRPLSQKSVSHRKMQNDTTCLEPGKCTANNNN